MIGYDNAITNVKTPLPLPTNQDPPSSLVVSQIILPTQISLYNTTNGTNSIDQTIAEQSLQFLEMTSLAISGYYSSASTHQPRSSIISSCITNYTANADLSLQYHERNKLNRPNNRRTIPPISGDDIIGNLLHNQMINDPHPYCHRWPWKNWTHATSKPLWHIPTSHTSTKTIRTK